MKDPHSRSLALLLTLGLCSVAHPQTADDAIFSRYLPEGYLPGRVVSVTLEAELSWGSSLYADAFEIVPPGWQFAGSDHQLTDLDPETGTVHWRLHEYTDLTGLPWGFEIRYDVVPPLDQRGEVSFDGYWNYAFRQQDPTAYAETAGGTTLSDRQGKLLYHPALARIQETIDACEWGDTVMVSAKDVPFAEHINMKPGVNLVGYIEPGSSGPPSIRSNSWPLPAITAAPYTNVSGFIIGWSATGIRVGDATVEISNCVITGTQDAAIEYVGAIEGKITNCTIVGNNAAGIVCHDPSPGVVVSNSILFGNGGRDFENCTARFCLLEDEIEPGSGENNIFADPMFVNAEAGDYRPLRGSPSIDAGDGAGIGPEDMDILGKPRILFGGKSQAVDIGDYEYWFISASRQPGSSDLQLRWSSPADGGETTYSVFYSFDLTTWRLADDNVPSAGATTLWLDPIGWPPPIPTCFYRVTENE